MAAKTFPYAVIWNGEVVPPNTPIEVVEENTATVKQRKRAVKKDDTTADRES